MGAALHDVGKIGVPDAILRKPGPLTAAEFEVVRGPAGLGHSLLAERDGQDLLRSAAELAWTHHERWDGAGYREDSAARRSRSRVGSPRSPTSSTLSTRRVYRKAFDLDQVVDRMRRDRGIHFDPALLDLVLAAIDQVTAIKASYPD